MNPWSQLIGALPAAAGEVGNIVSLFFYSGPGLIFAPFIVMGFLFMAIEIFVHGGRINVSGIQDIQFRIRNRGR